MSTTGMAVPEAAVHEYRGTIPGKHQVGRARQVLPVQAKPETTRVHRLPDGDLGTGAAPADTRHHARSHLGGYDIDHVSLQPTA